MAALRNGTGAKNLKVDTLPSLEFQSSQDDFDRHKVTGNRKRYCADRQVPLDAKTRACLKNLNKESSNMKKLFCVVVLNLLMLVNSAFARDTPAQDSSIEKLFAIMGMDQQMQSGFEAMLPLVDQQAAQLNLTPSAKQELRNIYRNWFINDIDRKEINAKIVRLYAETFSEPEINELISFYQSPIGRKFLQESPRLTKIGAKIGMDEARAKQYLLNRRLQPFLDVHAK